jgi:putative flippase GtrA
MKATFGRYGISGVAFTLIGPSLFWLAYPAGPLLAWAFAELSCHILRYTSFRLFVFPRRHGYRVSVPRYLVSIMPTSMSTLALVGLLGRVLSRNMLTLCAAVVSVTVGFVWSHYIYTTQSDSSKSRKQV